MHAHAHTYTRTQTYLMIVFQVNNHSRFSLTSKELMIILQNSSVQVEQSFYITSSIVDAILKVFLGTNNDTIAYTHYNYTCSLTGGGTTPLAVVPYEEKIFIIAHSDNNSYWLTGGPGGP